MEAAPRSKVPRPKPGVTFAPTTPATGAAASTKVHVVQDEKSKSSAGGVTKEAQEAAVKRVQAAVPHATADVAVKVLSGCDFDVQAAVNTLLDCDTTREALSQWGKADKRGRTPTRVRPPPKPSPLQSQHLAGGVPPKLPSHIAVYRRGEVCEEEGPSRAEQARFRRMHHNVDVTLQAGGGGQVLHGQQQQPARQAVGRPPLAQAGSGPAPAEGNVLLRAAAQEARLRSEEEKIRAARLAAEERAHALRTEEERLQRLLSGLHVMTVIRAADAALEAVAAEAQNATHAVDAAAAAAQAAVRSQCAALRKLIDDRESALLSDVDAAQRCAADRIADVRCAGDACGETLSAARIAALAGSEPGGQAHPQATTDAAVAQLHTLAAQLRAMTTGAPAVAVAFAQQGIAQHVASFGAVSCALSPPPAMAEPAAEVPQGSSEAAPKTAHVGPPTYAGMVLSAPPCAAPGDHSMGQGPCSPTSPPPPECPEAFPSLPRAHGAKGRASAAKKGHGAAAGADATSKLSVLAPAGPDSVSDVSSDGAAERAELWF